jgi:hypothetical protein
MHADVISLVVTDFMMNNTNLVAKFIKKKKKGVTAPNLLLSGSLIHNELHYKLK